MGDSINRYWTIAIGAVGLVVPVVSVSADDQQEVEPVNSRDIVVFGSRADGTVSAGLYAEAEIDQNGIAALGVDTVGDLLGQLSQENGLGGEAPVILVNGQPSNGLDDVSDLPVEAVSKIQLLPRQAAGDLGQSPTRRVVNVVIKPDHRQVTTRLTLGLATKGGGFHAEGELSYLKLQNSNRRSLTLRVSHNDDLLEGERNIVGSTDGTPFDFVGNIVSAPVPGWEIDPALSQLVGRSVQIAGVPAGIAIPTLSDFVATADQPNFADTGKFRTLLPQSRIYSAVGNITEKLGARTTLSWALRGERTESGGLTGPTASSLLLPSTSPFSPFGSDVILARFLGNALQQQSNVTLVSSAVVVNRQAGKWRFSLNSNFAYRVSHTNSERGVDITDLQDGILNGTLNPFVSIPDDLLDSIERDQARSRVINAITSLNANGTPFSLPAGPVNAAVRLEWRADRTNSRTTGLINIPDRRLHRDEALAQFSFRLPIIGSAQSFPLGDVGLELSGALKNVTAAGGLRNYGYAFFWQLDQNFSMRAAYNQDQIAPPSNAITDAVIAIDGARAYDFVRQESVFVRYTTGGNPDLGVEKRRVTTISANFRPASLPDLSLDAEYVRVIGKNAFSALPPINAEIQLAFPDRFVRDSNGVLISIDARPVPFLRVALEQLRWGGNFSRSFGSTGSEDGEKLLPGWRANAFFSHQWTLSSTRQARATLPVIDLLDGGAIGYGGGQSRHQVQLGAGVVHKGIGFQMNGDWRGRSRIATGTATAPDELRYASQELVNVRLFANLGPHFPKSAIAKGMRLTLEVDNLFDSQQRVRDNNGAKPVRFQRYLLDPMGRAIKFSLRKVF